MGNLGSICHCENFECTWPTFEAEKQVVKCENHKGVILAVARPCLLGMRTLYSECPRCSASEPEQKSTFFGVADVANILKATDDVKVEMENFQRQLHESSSAANSPDLSTAFALVFRKFDAVKGKIDQVRSDCVLHEQISNCKTIRDITDVYRCDEFDKRITEFERLQKGEDRVQWAKSWAEKLAQGDGDAKRLNNNRRLCLELLYVMCNHWKRSEEEDPHEKPITTDQIVTKFKPQRVHRILSVCLVMDRANAWYNMVDTLTNNPGMHWYSCNHTDLVESWRQQFGGDRLNTPTINKRLTWLFDCEGLELQHDPFLVELMKPARTPLASVSPNQEAPNSDPAAHQEESDHPRSPNKCSIS